MEYRDFKIGPRIQVCCVLRGLHKRDRMEWGRNIIDLDGQKRWIQSSLKEAKRRVDVWYGNENTEITTMRKDILEVRTP